VPEQVYIHTIMTSPQEEKKPYIDAIKSVRNKATNVDLSSLPRALSILTHPASNTKIPVWRFCLDSKPISRNNDILIGYDCLNCHVRNEITLNLYIRKVSKNIRCCNACKNLDLQKRSDHVAYMLGERIPPSAVVKWSDKPLDLRLRESEEAFLEEDSAFQTSYFLRHFTKDEFERVRSKIVSVGQGKLKDLRGWEYFPFYRIWNQTKYTPMLINPLDNRIEKPEYCQWTCDECEQAFTNRDIEVQKNRIRILCVDCGFCNRTFKVRSLTTPWDKVRYQSIQERRFIEWCSENKIRVTNGPKISYKFGEKIHKYSVDFQIPAFKILVEIKDNHIWHKQQIDSGKWGKKEEAARNWAKANGWTYDMVFPKTLSKWKQDILVRYSLILQETVRSKDKEPCVNIGGNL
jgi:hypothetical protein